MHPGQLDIDADIVAGLVADQFPQWRGQAVRRVESGGTVNAQFRLGDHVVLRFPLVKTSADELATEAGHARRIAPAVPLAVPEPLGRGQPGPGYPGPWAAYRWIDGTVATPDTFGETEARELARFVRALRAIGTGGREWPGRGRGGPLDGQDAWVRHSLSLSHDLIDTVRLTTMWDDTGSAPGVPGSTGGRRRDLGPRARLGAGPGDRRPAVLPAVESAMARTSARTLNSILSDEESR